MHIHWYWEVFACVADANDNDTSFQHHRFSFAHSLWRVDVWMWLYDAQICAIGWNWIGNFSHFFHPYRNYARNYLVSMSISDRSMSLRADTTSHLGGIKPSSQCFTTSFSAPSTSQHNRYISSIFSISEVQPECTACAAAPCSTTTTLHMRRTPSTKLWAAYGGAMRWISVFFPSFLAVCRPKTSTTQIYTQLSNFRTATWHVDGIYKAHTAHTHTATHPAKSVTTHKISNII